MKIFSKIDKLANFTKFIVPSQNVLLLDKLNRWDRRRWLLINVKPSNVLRPPVKEMMFDVVWSLQSQRVAPQLSSSTFVSLSLLSCTKTSFSTNRTIKFDIALPVWSHPAITFQKRNYSFSTAAVNLLLLSFLESNLPRNHHSWVWQLELDTPIDILRSAADPNYPPFGQQEDSLVSSRCLRK